MFIYWLKVGGLAIVAFFFTMRMKYIGSKVKRGAPGVIFSPLAYINFIFLCYCGYRIYEKHTIWAALIIFFSSWFISANINTGFCHILYDVKDADTPYERTRIFLSVSFVSSLIGIIALPICDYFLFKMI